MKDWKTIAIANGLAPSGETEAAARTLGALEEAFAPLIRNLPRDLEPATTLRFPEDEA